MRYEAIIWALLGLLSVIWVPKTHPSWSRLGLAGLWAFWVVFVVFMGPLGLFAALRSHHKDPCPLWWQRGRDA